ncbi:hypothetical protein B0T21DRAFT_386697 [Apiosordaria backusii]|uniref:Uncharacterized protein n=1 Tax=Apiosordaria backusii TaxID=314023 RepID=A0AA40ANG7_9PEZI|nr:hypothetical protein B0T21DRAFT_386697 [Apiosordaria backusii]
MMSHPRIRCCATGASRPCISCPFTRPFHCAVFHVGVDGERRGDQPTRLPSFTSALTTSLWPIQSPNRAALCGREQTDGSKSLRLPLPPLVSRFCFFSSQDSHEGGSHKIPYVFLGSIAAASLLAHKYWPKGYIYGDKEDWELSKYERRARERLQAEKAAKRGKQNEREVKGYDSTSPPPPAYEDREARRAGYGHRGPPPVSHRREEYEEREEVYSNPGGGSSGPNSRRGSLTGPTPRGRIDPRDYYHDDRAYSRGRPDHATAPSALRSRSQSGRDYFYPTVYTRSASRDRSLPPRRASSVVEDDYYMTPAIGPAADRKRDNYYPPAPQRSYLAERESSRPTYLIENSRVEPSLFARSESTRGRESQRRPYYEEDYAAARAPKEGAVYVYRDAAPARTRRASVDLGGGRNRVYDWDYR